MKLLTDYGFRDPLSYEERCKLARAHYAPVEKHNTECASMAYKKVEPLGFWTPGTDDEIEGQVIGVFPNNMYGVQLSIRPFDGSEDILTPSHKVLQGLITKQNVKIGDNVKIVCCGEAPTSKAGQSPARLYELYIDDAKSSAVKSVPIKRK